MNFQVNSDTAEAMTVWRRHQYTKAIAPFLIVTWLIMILVLYDKHQDDGSKYIDDLLKKRNCVQVGDDSDVSSRFRDCSGLKDNHYYFSKIENNGYHIYLREVQCDEDVRFIYSASMLSTYEHFTVVKTIIEILVPIAFAWYVWEVLYLSLYDLLPLQIKPPSSWKKLFRGFFCDCNGRDGLVSGELEVNDWVARVGILCGLEATNYEAKELAEIMYMANIMHPVPPVRAAPPLDGGRAGPASIFSLFYSHAAHISAIKAEEQVKSIMNDKAIASVRETVAYGSAILHDSAARGQINASVLRSTLNEATGFVNANNAVAAAACGKKVADIVSAATRDSTIASTHGVRLPVSYIVGCLLFFGVVTGSLVFAFMEDSIDECTLFGDKVTLSRSLFTYSFFIGFIAVVLMALSIPQWLLLWSVINLELVTARYKFFFESRMKYRRSYLFSTRSVFHWLVTIAALPMLLLLAVHGLIWASWQLCRLMWSEPYVAFNAAPITTLFKFAIEKIPSTDSLYSDLHPPLFHRLKSLGLSDEHATSAIHLISAFRTNPELTTHLLLSMDQTQRQQKLACLNSIPLPDEDFGPLLSAIVDVDDPNPPPRK